MNNSKGGVRMDSFKFFRSGSIKIFMLILTLVFTVASVSYPVYATHTSTASLEPEWSPANSQVDYTVTFCKITGDTVNEVRIYKNYDGSVYYTNFQCDEKPGWELLYIGSYPACFYVANSSSPYYDPLDDDNECENFTFSAHTPPSGPQYCDLAWRFETRDVNEQWKFLYDNTSVDDVEPEITKTIIGAQSGTCPPGASGECWITQTTKINVSVKEKGVCGISGLDWCEITYTVDGTGPYQEVFQDLNGENYWEYIFSFDEDSVHILNITCMDIAGNKVEDIEKFKVDSVPPTTKKDYGQPYYSNGGAEWINSSTPITLTATDGGDICHVGGVITYYRDFWLPEHDEICYELCHPENYGKYVNPSKPFKKYTGPFYKEEESCHVIEFYSVDALGNTEPMKWQCVFVDNTPPVGTKIVGDPRAGVEFKSLGNGEAKWTRDQSHSGDYSVKLTSPVGPSDVALARITRDFGKFSDITELSYWTYLEGGELGYHPYIQVWIDMDDDGDIYDFSEGGANLFQAEPYYAWQYYGYPGPSPGWNEWRSFGTPSLVWFDINWDGNVDSLKPLNYWQNIYGDYPVKRIVVQVGYGTGWDNTIAYTDDLILNGKTILSEPFTTPTWVTQNTSITLNCTDPWPHPVNHEKVCYRVSFDSPENYITGEYCEPQFLKNGWCCVDSPITIKFKEDSFHDLEYYCVDALGNKNEVDIEYFKVDSQPPVITKTMIGDDHLGDCPPEYKPDGTTHICYVKDDGQNGVHIDVEDNQTYPECAVGVDYCNYGLWWYTDETTCKNKYGNDAWDGYKCLVDTGIFGEEGKDIYFTEDSTHELYISCWDLLGNQMMDVETFLVDSKPPITTKTYGEPSKEEDGKHWITSSTPIILTATDEKVGVDYIKYRYCLYSGCYGGCDCDCGEGNWTTVKDNGVGDVNSEVGSIETTFIIPNESEHCIEYYAVDKLGNVEDTKSQCVYVDNTPPHSVKEHDGILIEGDGFNWITNKTLITLDCEDPEPHPVSEETLCFKVSLDDDGLTYITDKYCSEFGGTYNETTGYCCVYVGEEPGQFENKFTFHFLEDSCHNLEYYCVDYLGNDERDPMDGKPHIQWYKVDSVPPTTTKTYIPDAYVDPETGYEYIDTIHNVSLKAEDGGDICAIGVDKIQYRVSGPLDKCWCEEKCEQWNPNYEGEWNTYTEPFKIPEESCHVIEYRSIDKLGNTEDIKWQCVFVDKTPPVTNKYYEGPQWPEDNDDGPKWISSETLVVLDPYDPESHPSGVNKTWYRDVYLPDEEDWHYCYEDCYNWTNDTRATVWGLPTAPEPYNPSSHGFVLYDGPFKLQNESCHIIEYYSYDNVGKVEEVKHQCVFVDNTPPIPNKTVSEPKDKWYPTQDEEIFYPGISKQCWNENSGNYIECWKIPLKTPVRLECIDEGPHPVDHNRVCFRVELDGEDATQKYCSWYGGNYNLTGDGFCCVNRTIDEFYFIEETYHELEYYCVDALGNKGPIDKEKFKVEGKIFEIKLNKKWNLISVPVELLNDTPEAVFKDVKDSIESVWTYDPEHETCENDWCVYVPDESGTLENIKPGWGYWVLANKDDMLVIGGSIVKPGPNVPPSRHLVKGWNLIGYYGTYGLPGYYGPKNHKPWGHGKYAYCALYSLVNLEGPILTEWTALGTYWEPRNPNQWIGLDRCDRMDPGAGYWIWMKVEDEYAIATACPSELWDMLCRGL